MKKREPLVLAYFLLVSCAEPSAPTHHDALVSSPLAVSDAAIATVDAGDALDASTTDAAAGSTPEPKIGRTEAIDLLFTSMKDGIAPPACDEDDAVKCLLNARYSRDEAARAMAVSLFEKTGSVAGVDREHVMDGGYRGMLHLVPVLPMGESKVHLQHMTFALTAFDTFFQKLESQGNSRVKYRWRNLALRFFRSVKARTPSAYASGWTIAYNVDGSLNKSDLAVRETMFHEIFHLNDADHGKRDLRERLSRDSRDAAGDGWSEHALAPTYDAIVSKCKNSTPCLSKFAPNDTMVRGGTYYAFQPGNDVREYAAELAVRYFKEQSAAIAPTSSADHPGGGIPFGLKTPFKCTGSENATSWKAMVLEFFGGIDLTVACP